MRCPRNASPNVAWLAGTSPTHCRRRSGQSAAVHEWRSARANEPRRCCSNPRTPAGRTRRACQRAGAGAREGASTRLVCSRKRRLARVFVENPPQADHARPVVGRHELRTHLVTHGARLGRVAPVAALQVEKPDVGHRRVRRFVEVERARRTVVAHSLDSRATGSVSGRPAVRRRAADSRELQRAHGSWGTCKAAATAHAPPGQCCPTS